MSDSVKYITLTAENFEAEVLNSQIPVVVDFFAPWCGPCRVMNPIVTKLAEEWFGKVKVGKINIDDNEDLATKYRIEAIPTILFFNNGEVVKNFPGLTSHANLTEEISQLLAVEAEKASV